MHVISHCWTISFIITRIISWKFRLMRMIGIWWGIWGVKVVVHALIHRKLLLMLTYRSILLLCHESVSIVIFKLLKEFRVCRKVDETRKVWVVVTHVATYVVETATWSHRWFVEAKNGCDCEWLARTLVHNFEWGSRSVAITVVIANFDLCRFTLHRVLWQVICRWQGVIVVIIVVRVQIKEMWKWIWMVLGCLIDHFIWIKHGNWFSSDRKKEKKRANKTKRSSDEIK